MNYHCNRNWNGFGGCGGWCWGASNGCGCANGHTLSGTVTSTTGGSTAGMTIQYTVNGTTYTTTTDASGRYTVTVPRCANVTVSMGPLVGVTVSPPQYVLSNVCADWNNLDFALTPVTGATYTVSGTVSGLSNNANVPVNYTINDVPGSTTTDALGNYSFTAPAGANVVITPSSQSGFLVLPASYALAPLAGDVTNRDFIYVQQARNAVISGNVSTPQGPVRDALVTYALNGQTLTTLTDAFGNYAFSVPIGASVVITPPVVAGATPSPTSIALSNVAGNTGGQNFTYTAV